MPTVPPHPHPQTWREVLSDRPLDDLEQLIGAVGGADAQLLQQLHQQAAEAPERARQAHLRAGTPGCMHACVGGGVVCSGKTGSWQACDCELTSPDPNAGGGNLTCGFTWMSTFFPVCTYSPFSLPALFRGLSRMASSACSEGAAGCGKRFWGVSAPYAGMIDQEWDQASMLLLLQSCRPLPGIHLLLALAEGAIVVALQAAVEGWRRAAPGGRCRACMRRGLCCVASGSWRGRHS